MDVVLLTASIISLVGIVSYTAATAYQLALGIKNAPFERSVLLDEFRVLQRVLYESAVTIESSSTVPESVRDSFRLCKARGNRLDYLLNKTELRVYQKYCILRSGWAWVNSSGQRKRLNDSFRDAVLLLRDLVSE